MYLRPHFSGAHGYSVVHCNKDIFLNSLGDVNILPLVLEAASNLGERPSDKEMNDMAKKMSLASIFGV